MEPSETRFRTDIWPLGNSRATTIPRRILMWTQAPDGDEAEVRWKYDSDRPPQLFIEFGRTSDERSHDTYCRRTTIQKRSEGSRATAIPKEVLRGEEAEGSDEAIWTFDLRDEYPVRVEFTAADEAGDGE